MADQAEKRTYKKTLNLPKTSFSMKANLVQNEPASQKRWAADKLYEKIREKRAGSPRYVFHDGPPYANGSIHLGHLLNKVLKDFVVRTKNMAGLDCPYVPGWDCHGLPIEHKVMQELGDKAREMDTMKIRRKCKSYAEKFIKLQMGQMKRLSTLAEYDNPYITMDPAYEAAVLEVFSDLVGKDLVYRDLKPVHWSIANQTALAEAELEYYDREDASIYVLFELENPQVLPDSMMARPGEAYSIMIWTTTPWTLPANMAAAVHPSHSYGLFRWEHESRGGMVVMATELHERAFDAVEATFELVGECTGAELEAAGLRYHHPFIERTSPVVTADYVTLEDGTGVVHTAPGHGAEDYMTGLNKRMHFVERDEMQHVEWVSPAEAKGKDPAELPHANIYCPVLEDGTFNQTAPDWLQGKTVWDANELVMNELRESGHMYHDHMFTHSYPHDWRSKTPVIFRATEQWFISVDRAADGQSLRQRALDTTGNKVKFFPEWGRNRMRGMLETRPDWCISRQRAWGLPIPAFYGPERGQVLLTAASVKAVADKFREKGSDAWFFAEPSDLLAYYDAVNDPAAPDWVKSEISNFKSQITKAHDIFDVWFESGSSWNAVIRQRFGNDAYPTDLYLEGSDQHRGWFQLSLLPALGVTGQSPFKNVLTHGFMVDKEGKKLSKSAGHTIEELEKMYGSDVLRWWVSSLNTDNDIKVDDEFFKTAGEEYRKVRNTLRFVLSNLGDFNFDEQKARFEDEDARSIDAWATNEIIKLSDTVNAAYDAFEYRKAHTALFDFCNETMSAQYLAAVKDRLYCDKVDSHRRRRTQTTLYRITTALVRLLAPLLPHTADEAWRALMGDDAECVHLLNFQNVDCMRQIPVDDAWEDVLATHREQWMRELEQFRQSKGVDNPLDCGIEAPTDEKLSKLDTVDLADLCGVSRFSFSDVDSPKVIDLREEPRCERSWKRDVTVEERSDGGMLSARDAEAVGV